MRLRIRVARLRSSIAAVALAIGVSSACVRTQPYANLSDTAEPLRAQFNQDAGHVRVMMLVAPT